MKCSCISQVHYKADYNQNIKGKGATVTHEPTMLLACAQKATKINNEV